MSTSCRPSPANCHWCEGTFSYLLSPEDFQFYLVRHFEYKQHICTSPLPYVIGLGFFVWALIDTWWVGNYHTQYCCSFGIMVMTNLLHSPNQLCRGVEPSTHTRPRPLRSPGPSYSLSSANSSNPNAKPKPNKIKTPETQSQIAGTNNKVGICASALVFAQSASDMQLFIH